MDKEKYFLFYRSFLEAFEDMPGEQFKEIIMAIARYALDGLEPEGLSPMSRMAFSLIRPNIDSTCRRREGGGKGGKYGALGGRPRAGMPGEAKNPLGVLDCDGKNPLGVGEETPALRIRNKEDGIRNEEEGIGNEEDGIRNEEEGIGNEEDGIRNGEGDEGARSEDKEAGEAGGLEAPPPGTPWKEEVMRHWNALPEPIPKVNCISQKGTRMRMLKARVKENGIRAVIDAVDRVGESDFLCGKNKKGWWATFDWFIKPDNFAKVADGNYSNRPEWAAPGTSGSAYLDRIDSRISDVDGWLERSREKYGDDPGGVFDTG